MEVNQANISEMKEVRRLGTKVLGLVDFDAIESAWKKILEEEAANAVPNPESDETENGEEGEETVDDATRFIESVSYTHLSIELYLVQPILYFHLHPVYPNNQVSYPYLPVEETVYRQ